MTPGHAHILFELDGRRYDYTGAMPDELADRVAPHLDANGLFVDRPDLSEQCKDLEDGLPDAIWEIQTIGGKVISIEGQRANGAIHWADWKNPRVY